MSCEPTYTSSITTRTKRDTVMYKVITLIRGSLARARRSCPMRQRGWRGSATHGVQTVLRYKHYMPSNSGTTLWPKINTLLIILHFVLNIIESRLRRTDCHSHAQCTWFNDIVKISKLLQTARDPASAAAKHPRASPIFIRTATCDRHPYL